MKENVRRTEYEKSNIQQIISLVEKYNWVSFDIYDTLLYRNVTEPEDIFTIVSLRAQKKGIPNAKEFAKEEELIFLCGHYEGIDERVLEEVVTDYVSIGDYVLTGGELPALVMMDAISRLVEGVLNNDVSAETETFQDHLLEYPQYSRPEEWRGKKVPEVLLSGHHGNVEKWRKEQSVLRTMKWRPDLWEKAKEPLMKQLTKKELKRLNEFLKGEEGNV